MSKKKYAKDLIDTYAVFQDIAEQRETLWINDKYVPFDLVDGLCQLIVSDQDIKEAEDRLKRFAPYIRKCFPETLPDEGLIESPLRNIRKMRKVLSQNGISERLFLKMDSHLAIAGSVKARGGIYEVLQYAEKLALDSGIITVEDNYEQFAEEKVKDFFRKFTIQVGSTGNLGLSIGIMSAVLGFKVRVHMSADTREWKKELLRSKGVEVIEYIGDYSEAVREGRRDSERDPLSYFVDDENSRALFLGYAVAAKRLQKQLEEKEITIDEAHPLIVYLPCGVGGAPGGICYGLKRVFRDHVHVFFCEPTLFPSVLIGMASNRYNEINVSDFGLGSCSEADGLACAAPSGFVTRIDRNLVSGIFTVKDDNLFSYMKQLMDTEDLFVEPSACAAFHGAVHLMEEVSGRDYLKKQGLDAETLSNAVQICWATGGSLVPREVREEYLKRSREK